MKIVMLDRNSIGMDIDVSIFSKFGDFEAYDVASRDLTKARIKDAEVIIFNKTVMDEVYHIAGKERCKLINQTIQADRNLYILANLNVRQVRDSGKWRPRL